MLNRFSMSREKFRARATEAGIADHIWGRRGNRSVSGECVVKIYINFGGAEISMESVEERRIWKQFRSLFNGRLN